MTNEIILSHEYIFLLSKKMTNEIILNVSATIQLTDTMVNKYIIDARQDMQKLALASGFDYQLAEKGQKFKIPAMWADGSVASLTFYRANTRGDKRVSISQLRKHANSGDEIKVTLSEVTHDESGKRQMLATITNITN